MEYETRVIDNVTRNGRGHSDGKTGAIIGLQRDGGAVKPHIK